nr:hypothetical protein [Nitrosomonas nitrosa]
MPITFHSGAELGISTAAYLHLAASMANVVLALDTQYTNQCEEIATERHFIDRDKSSWFPVKPQY